ncbi:MAG: hypothetical protein IJF69_03420 [Clostridia bacterium]|nr:hypothetical protein [Clostridia bacterium]
MKNLKMLLAVLLLGCMVFALCACGGNTSDDETTDADTTVEDTTVEDTTKEDVAAFQVKVVDGDGNAVPGTMVQICKDFCVFAQADDKGVASFDIEITDGHKLSVLSCPDGYEYTGDAEIYLESGISEYVLEISKVN